MTRLGISLGWSSREPADRIVGLVRRAEELGVDTCWVVDSQLAMRDAFVLLAILARETESIALGPGVTNLVTRHETVVANAVATLASVAPGRILLGLGAGDSAVFSIGRKPQRVDDLRRGIDRLRRLLAGEDVEGRARPLHLSSAPDPPPPIHVAASQPRMLELAGAVADGVIIMGPADPEVIRLQMESIDGGARTAGRDPGEVERDLWVTMAVGEPSDAVGAVRSWASTQARWLARWERLPESLEPFRPEMERAARVYDFDDHLSVSARHARVVGDELAMRLAVAGPLETCRDRLSALVSLGPSRVTLALLSGGRGRRLEEIVDVWQGVRPVGEARQRAGAGDA